MKKLILSVFTSLLMVFAAGAQSFTFDDVCSKLAEHPNMTGDFSQEKLLKNAARPMKSNGTFIFSTEGLMWKTLKPFPSNMIVTKTFVTQTNSKGKSTTTDVSQNQVFGNVSSMLTSIFNGNADQLKASFNVSFTQSGSEWKTVLTPKDENIGKVLKNLEISGIYGTTSEIKKMVMTESSDSKTTYNLTNVKYPQELSADEKSIFAEK